MLVLLNVGFRRVPGSMSRDSSALHGAVFYHPMVCLTWTWDVMHAAQTPSGCEFYVPAPALFLRPKDVVPPCRKLSNYSSAFSFRRGRALDEHCSELPSLDSPLPLAALIAVPQNAVDRKGGAFCYLRIHEAAGENEHPSICAGAINHNSTSKNVLTCGNKPVREVEDGRTNNNHHRKSLRAKLSL